MGKPIDLEEFAMDAALLVDTFGVYERRGSSTEPSLRVINNFKANQSNEFAYMTEKLQYDSFGQLKSAMRRLKRISNSKLQLGKADFKSAFKTLPPSKDQEWLCYALI